MTHDTTLRSDGDALLTAIEDLAWREDDAAERSYGQLAYHADSRRWVITELAPQVAIRAKRIFPRIASTQVGSYTFADNDEVRTELEWFIARYPLVISENDRARLIQGRLAFARIRAEIDQVLNRSWQPTSAPKRLREGKQLRPNQARAVEVARRTGRLLVADDVGLGKTLGALAAVMDEAYLPAAVFAEAHVASQWQDDFIGKFTTLSSHVVQTVEPYVLMDRDIYIFSYSKAPGWVNIAETGRFRSVIFDEVQNLRHGVRTEKGRAAEVFARNAGGLRIGLSATPVFGYGGEIFNILDIIEPGILGTREEFMREWCTSDDEGKMIVKEPAALGAHLRDLNLMIREVGSGPPPNRIIHDVPYDEDAAAADEAFARVLAQRVMTGSFTERGQAARELDMMARHATGVAKAAHVAAYVKILLEAKTPIILGGWHRDVYDIWLKELAPYKPVLYTGSETTRDKDRAKRAFMSGDTDCFIMSLRSGAGLDGLQHRCSTVVHGELDWSREVHKQLAGRLRPHARTDPITEIYLIANGGSDPLIASVQGLKASQAHGIIDPGRGVQRVDSDDSRIKALARMYLERGNS
ncbi:SNF2-related protein [Bradyrhizobium sp. SZCCHNR1020]|uniref:SNF2-related protein n=1 Tax=Bradyrhizobium sp. SZCCHNR1020 TaxID=3057343 RepID=UPI0029169696|nr:SNF2-related protein [Bradyrhizobium sp. SZCCHNR1020]